MTEVLLYHLQRQPLEAVLPQLLLRSLDRGWRAVVKLASPDRMAAIDDHLWSFSDESFLPHGTDGEPDAAAQPVLLSMSDTNANGAHVLFVADGAAFPDDFGGYARAVMMLDGNDDDAVAAARITWRRLKAEGHEVTYWQQDESGRWQKRG